MGIVHMRSRLQGAATVALTVMSLAACSSSSSPVVGPIVGFSESDLAGRFALSAPYTNADGVRIVADTLVLGADRSARRYFYVADDAGAATGRWHGGAYEISGTGIRIEYTTTSYGAYGLFDVVTMAVLGTSSRVTRLEIDRPDGKLTYNRVRAR